MGRVLTDARTVLLEHTVTSLAKLVNMAKTVRFNVRQIAMDHVDILMDHVQFVREAGMVTIAVKNVSSLMGKIVCIHAVRTATTRHATDLMDDAFIVVQTGFMESCVMKDM